MRRNFVFITLFIGLVALTPSFARASGGSPTSPPTVERVELSRYLGAWHEIARIPNRFQDNTTSKGLGPCTMTRAEYAPLDGGRIGVRNTCWRKSPKGTSVADVAEAIATPRAESGNSKLVVNFTGVAMLRLFGIGNGDYWIFALGPVDEEGFYAWALVGSPSFKTGWVLARDSRFGSENLAAVLEQAARIGFDPSRFKPTARE